MTDKPSPNEILAKELCEYIFEKFKAGWTAIDCEKAVLDAFDVLIDEAKRPEFKLSNIKPKGP